MELGFFQRRLNPNFSEPSYLKAGVVFSEKHKTKPNLGVDFI